MLVPFVTSTSAIHAGTCGAVTLAASFLIAFYLRRGVGAVDGCRDTCGFFPNSVAIGTRVVSLAGQPLDSGF
jgi:hypothetical protein